MDQDLAQVVFVVLWGIGLVVWLSASAFLMYTARMGRMQAASKDEGFFAEGDERNEGEVAGSVEVEGEPAALCAKAASWVGNMGTPGFLKIISCDDRQLVFEQAGSGMGQTSGWGLKRGTMRFERSKSDRTLIRYMAELSSPRWLLWLGSVFVIVGGIGLVVGGSLIWHFIVNSGNPSLRWQVFQTVQTYHLLWPPFLFGGLYRTLRKRAIAQLDSLAHNLPYMDTSAPGGMRMMPLHRG